jgi:fructan beta-fructosidase
MTFPVELTLRPFPDGPRLFAEPVDEIKALLLAKHKEEARELKEGDHPVEFKGEPGFVSVQWQPKGAEEVDLTVCGVPIRYAVKKRQLSCGDHVAPLEPAKGLITLTILLDRGSVEVFGNSGQVAIVRGGILPAGQKGITLSVRGGSAVMTGLGVAELKSAWAK